MKMRLLPTLEGLVIGFAAPSIAQDAMKTVTADELVFHPVDLHAWVTVDSQ